MSNNSSSEITVQIADVVIVEWKDLIVDENCNNSIIRDAIRKAYGRTGTGILAIRNVPGFVRAKNAFLPLAHTLATQLPADYLENELTDASSLYNAGWSHGKEKLGANAKPDIAKGSFYYNPVTDCPGTEEDRAAYPHSYPCNVWPSSRYIPEFKERAVTIGLILKDAAVAVARHLDALAASNTHEPNQKKNQVLYDALQNTDKVKARLLYYFPLQEDDDNEKAPTSAHAATEDSWIGWHNDSGFLTALAGELYVDHITGLPLESCPDAAAGLYVVDRCSNNNSILKVEIPSDCLAVQVGECTEILTGGTVQATPHCVRGACHRFPNIARISLPCFVDAPPTFCLTAGRSSREQVLASSCSDKVPPLAARWERDGMTFGDFLQKTFSMYYGWDA